jgi:hypothetical protein
MRVVCVLPDGPLNLAAAHGSHHEKTTLSNSGVLTVKRQRPPSVGITGQVSLVAWAYGCHDRSTDNVGQGGDRPNAGTTRFRVGHGVGKLVAGSTSPSTRA